MGNKQTAVDYIESNVFWPIKLSELLIVLDKAKEIEKQQIMDAYSCGEHQQGYQGEAENYYNEVHGKTN